MKKMLFITLAISGFPIAAQAQETHGKFYENVLISSDVKQEERSDQAKDKASRLLDAKPNVIRIEGVSPTFRSRQNQASPAQPEITTTKYGEAPFGLSWGATYNQTRALGVTMEKIERRDAPNSFIVSKLPKPLPDFREVIISLGEDNSLWRLTAYGKYIEDDDAQANKVMRLFRQYYKLLGQRYGRAQQFFTPKISRTEKPYKDEYGRDQVQIIEREEPIGNNNFLEQLQNGEATLHATFEDNDVGVAMTVVVNEEGHSFLIIDYTNLRIFKEREDRVLNAL